jgi:hypothetical protein
MTEGTGWFREELTDSPAPNAPARTFEPAQTFPAAKGNVAIPAERDAFLSEAIRAGKFTEKRRAHYAALYDKDPVGTRELVASFASAPTAEQPEGKGWQATEGTGWF